MVRIEPLTEADIETLVALAREIWHAHYSSIISTAQIKYMLDQRYSPEVVRAELRKDGWWWDKLVVDDEMAGFASYFLLGQTADRMKLDKVYVHPRYQRRGYGGMMIARASTAASGRGCRWLELAVNKNNRPAIDAYVKRGFRLAAGVVKDIGGGFVMDDYIMEKTVTGER